MKFTRSQHLRPRAHAIIPGGAHTYAKGDDQYPELSPGFIARGQGCHVWDVDGNEFIEYGMGLRSVTLGHAYAPVVQAVARQIELGSNFVRPAAIELECAEMLLGMIPGAEMVKFAKDGSTVTTAALTLARAYTGRAMVAICSDHPFYSYNDWFIGTTAMAAGIPDAVRALTVGFRYNDLASAETLFAQYPGQIACVMLEPAKSADPAEGFLQQLKALCHANGALFVLDEMITGFRLHNGGGQARYGVEADLATYGKALANGFALSALVGKREFMERGGLQHEHQRVFLLSTTHGAETHTLAAGMATMQVYQHEPVVEFLNRQGRRLRDGINAAIAAEELEGYVQVIGLPANLVYATRDAERRDSQAFRTLMLQELIRRGVLAPSLVVSYSHSDDDIDRTVEAFAGAFQVYRRALEHGVNEYLVGRSVKPVFRERN